MNYSRNLLKMKKRSRKGFTLMEMLIVVAIIAILVAISVPVFASQLDKAREQTDAANVRAAKAVAVANYLTEGKGGTYYYNAEAGVLEDSKDDVTKGYGKSSGKENEIIEIIINPDGTFAEEDFDKWWVPKS
ncbi:prepilin-type N-terminal cleavage/methylation domain-containing protein [Lachnospiraceae bacterium 54-53]